MKQKLFSFLFCLVKLKWRIKGLLGIPTLGVRILVVRQNSFLFVKHTYTPGWYLPGGKIDKGMSAYDTAVKELIEETGVIPTAPLKLFGFYYNPSYGRDDYVATYLCEDFKEETKKPCHEISDIQWFNISALPDDIAPSAKRRVDEYVGKIGISDRL